MLPICNISNVFSAIDDIPSLYNWDIPRCHCMLHTDLPNARCQSSCRNTVLYRCKLDNNFFHLDKFVYKERRATIHPLAFLSGYRQVTIHPTSIRIVHALWAWTSSQLVLGCEYWRYSKEREQEPKAQYYYCSKFMNGDASPLLVNSHAFRIALIINKWWNAALSGRQIPAFLFHFCVTTSFFKNLRM